mmetsp:Transcript_37086/g.45244  ORF Transcript_37086/g.45244 Transcript_37086/m.45244 type:complete len:236 (+) Transcript_37086:429-1136(+)
MASITAMLVPTATTLQLLLTPSVMVMATGTPMRRLASTTDMVRVTASTNTIASSSSGTARMIATLTTPPTTTLTAWTQNTATAMCMSPATSTESRWALALPRATCTTRLDMLTIAALELSSLICLRDIITQATRAVSTWLPTDSATRQATSTATTASHPTCTEELMSTLQCRTTEAEITRTRLASTATCTSRETTATFLTTSNRAMTSSSTENHAADDLLTPPYSFLKAQTTCLS